MQVRDGVTRRRSQPGQPGELAQQLLQVCFLPAHEAGAVWDAALAGSLDLDALDVDLHGLLPLLHRRLLELDRTSPDLDRLKGVRRRLWVQNELRLRAVRGATDVVRAAGVPSALVGGAGVLVGHLGRADLRPLHDADLLVAPTDATIASAALHRAGWHVGPPWHGGFLLDLHGMRAQDPTGQSVSLRWSSWSPYLDATLHATQAELGDGHFDVVSTADLLVHTLLDGPPTHRASDALVILLGEHDLDWDRVDSSATARNARAAVRDALAALDAIVPLPPSVPPLHARATPRSTRPLADASPTLYRAYARRCAGRGTWTGLRGAPAYLCEVWDLPSATHLPLEIARRCRRRIARQR